MALVTFEDNNGNEIDINPDSVTSLSGYQHFDHDLELPDELMIINPSGLREVSNDPELLAKANELRTSERTIINGLITVKGSLADTRKALGIKASK